ELRAGGVELTHHLQLDHDDSGSARLVLESERVELEDSAELDPEVALGANDLFFINSTSGTTGLPKCVTQTHNRWKYFHQLARDAGDLTSEDRFMSMISAPFGFGLWT